MRRGLAVALLCGFSTSTAFAADPVPLVSPQSWLTVSLQQPWRLAENAMVRRFYATATESHLLQAAVNGDRTDLVREMLSVVEQATGERWDEALKHLTAGGVYLGVSGDDPPRFDVAVVADDETVLKRVIPQLEKWLLGRVAPQMVGQPLPSKTYAGVSYRELGEARYAVVGNRLLMSNREEGLHELIDRAREPIATNDSADLPVVHVRIDGEKLRSNPDFQMPLAWPANDAGAFALFGGWFDAVRNCEAIDVALGVTSRALDVNVSLPNGSGSEFQESAGLEGFFAPVDGSGIAPLLKPEGTIYSSSWYRDYKTLWSNREHSVTAEVRQRVEDADALTKTQFSQFGVQVPLSELLSTLGPSFRSVIARQDDSPYQVELKERFPAGAVVIQLQDESGFRKHFLPLLKTVNLIAMFSQAQMMTKSDTYRDIDLNSLMFADDEQAASKGNRFRYHFSPTFAIARGHFVWGSSVDLVKRLIDELESEAAAAVPAGVTERQFVASREVDSALQELRRQIVYRLLIGQGLSKDIAEAEVDLFSQALRSVGTVATEARRTNGGFEYNIHVEHDDRSSK